MGDAILDWFLEYPLKWIFILLLVGMCLLIPVLFFEAYKEGKKEFFSLKKDAWECTKWKRWTSTNYVLVGKVMTPVIHNHTECAQWTAKDARQ